MFSTQVTPESMFLTDTCSSDANIHMCKLVVRARFFKQGGLFWTNSGKVNHASWLLKGRPICFGGAYRIPYKTNYQDTPNKTAHPPWYILLAFELESRFRVLLTKRRRVERGYVVVFYAFAAGNYRLPDPISDHYYICLLRSYL